MADEASVQTSDVRENPSDSLNPDVGIKYPQYLKHDPNNKNCKCDKCMQVKFDDFWAGSAFSRKSFGYPSANNPLPAGHAEPNTSVPGVINHPKSTIESKNPL